MNGGSRGGEAEFGRTVIKDLEGNRSFIGMNTQIT